MKRILALFMALCMIFALCACGEKHEKEKEAEGIPDAMTSSDGKYEIAFVTDIGQLKDHSFNEGTWNGVKGYAAAKDLSYKSYQPANGKDATDDDIFEALKAACDGGAKVIVAAGAYQVTALSKAAEAFPDVKFIFIDGSIAGYDNIASLAFKEHESGFLAGYAAVMEGYTKLGFVGGGGGENESCCRYGYGFVQGANAAAEKKGINVEMNYSWKYGADFSVSTELEAMASEWYESGTEVIFCCGGSMYISVCSAASANNDLVIGVDSDQSYYSDCIITSAVKGVGEAAAWAIEKVYNGTFDAIGGVVSALGADDGAIGLPVDTWKFNNYSVERYKETFANIVSGKIEVDDDFANLIQQYSNLKLNIVE